MALAAPGGTSGAAAGHKKPNFVFLLADDLDETTTPYWDALPKTARLIRDRGLTFSNAFVPISLCCPARAALLTGKYGHNSGVLTNAGDQGGWPTFVRNGNEERTFAKGLADAGYRTALVGKYLNRYEERPRHIPPGWTEWYAATDNKFYKGYDYVLNENGTLVQYGSGESDYSTDVVARKSVEFIKRSAASGEPFMLYASPTAPHLGLRPPSRYRDHPWAQARAPERPNFQERDVSDKPAWLRKSAEERSAAVTKINNPDFRDRMGTLLAFDDMVAGVVDALRATGRLDDTYLVFVSDNGYNLGAHRLLDKMAPYEESIRVPLAIAGPGVRRGVDRHTVLNIDFAPTFLDLAGRPVPGDMDGRSLRPLLAGSAPPPKNWRTDLLVQYVGTPGLGIAQEKSSGPAGRRSADEGFDLPSFLGVRTGRYLYVRWYAPDDRPHEYELYDLKKDPYQLRNLLATADGRDRYARLVRKLDARLRILSTCKGVGCRS
ncbi:sulfatase [Actinomadura sp. 9N215]|uniref:sulfatase n=1 Tax=Actinomadura sp. 9N215 TaxID=3375150 RepID=UPI0037971214